MVELHFRVGADIVVGGRMHLLEGQGPSPGVGDMIRLPSMQGPAASAPPPQFFISAWLGGQSTACSVQPLNAQGVGEVRLPLCDGDVDTVKLSVTFNVRTPTVTPSGARNYHLATSFIPVSTLASLLRRTPKGDLQACPECFCLRDNFSKNIAVLKMANLSTDLSAVGRLQLKASALSQGDRVSEAVYRLGQRVHAQVAQCAISPSNAGPQYMDAFTYLPMEKTLSHYSILGMSLQKLDSPVDLDMVMYSAYQAVHSTGIHPAALAAMPDGDLVQCYGNVVITQHTACDRTAPYSSDLTFNQMGVVCKETENIRRSLSSVAMVTQGISTPFVRGRQCDSLPVTECVRQLGEAMKGYGTPEIRPSIGGDLCRDDCENQFIAISMYASGLKNVYLDAAGAQVPACASAAELPTKPQTLAQSLFGAHKPQAPAQALGLANTPQTLGLANIPQTLGLANTPQTLGLANTPQTPTQRLAAAMAERCKGNPLFANLRPEDHSLMAPILVRLGKMLHDGTWDVALGVVSAKGASFRADDPAASALSGHATGISRVRVGGKLSHAPTEGTTYLRVTPPVKQGLCSTLQVQLSTGEMHAFPLSDFATVVAQNVHELAGVTVDHRILAHLPSQFDNAQDIMLKCPFYVAAFYSGLTQGDGSLGCVPVDTNPPKGLGAGRKPLFGAPVMGLSLPTTMAVPVKPNLLAADLSDHQEAAELLGLLHQQASEIWSPRAPKETLHNLMTHWEPVQALDQDHLRTDYDSFIQSENTWAFDNPDHTAMAVRAYRAVADRFNALQAQDPQSDRIRATVHGKFRSAALTLNIDIPREGQPFKISCIKNLKRAVADAGLLGLVNAPLKMAHVGARAHIDSEHHVYMCDQGGGFVHAHRMKLA